MSPSSTAPGGGESRPNGQTPCLAQPSVHPRRSAIRTEDSDAGNCPMRTQEGDLWGTASRKDDAGQACMRRVPDCTIRAVFVVVATSRRRRVLQCVVSVLARVSPPTVRPRALALAVAPTLFNAPLLLARPPHCRPRRGPRWNTRLASRAAACSEIYRLDVNEELFPAYLFFR